MDEKTINESADRIVKLFAEKEIDLSKKSIVEDLTKLVDEKFDFALPINDAVRAVVGKYCRHHNVKIQFGGSSSGEVQAIKDLVPSTWVTIEGEIVEINKPDSKRIHQTAIITDGTGTIRVTVWNRQPDEPHVTDMKVGKWYKISNAIVNTYNDALSIGVQKSSIITAIDKKHKLAPELINIADVKPGMVSVCAKITRIFESKSDKVAQSGVLGDETGTINFVIWKSSEPKKPLKEGSVYTIAFAACSKFGDKLSLSISPHEVSASDKEMNVKTTNLTLIGNLVTVSEGSGIVKRCKVENCGRVLNRQNYCNTHEIQKDFKYDMRIKGIIDNGIESKYIHVPLKLTEQISGITLDQAIHTAETTPLGPDTIYMDIKEKLTGRYYQIEGNEINGRIIVSSMRLITFDEMKQATGLDFKIPDQSKLEV